jgi:Tol biopolymer transport system component
MPQRNVASLSSSTTVPFVSLLLVVATSAKAADKLWLAPVNGTFSDPARWVGGIPGSGDAAFFGSTSGGPFAVSVTLPHLLASLSVTNQKVTLDASAGGGITLLGGMNVKGPAAEAPSLTLANGAFIANGPIAIGGTGVVGELHQTSATLVGASLTLTEGSWSTSGSSIAAINGAVAIGDGATHEADARFDGAITIATNASPWNIGQNFGTGSLTLGPGVSANFGTHVVTVGGSTTTAGFGTLHLESGASMSTSAIRLAPLGNGVGTLVLDGGAYITMPGSIYLGPGTSTIEATDASIDIGPLRVKSETHPLTIALHGDSELSAPTLAFEPFSQALTQTTFTLTGGADLSIGTIKITGDLNLGLVAIDITDAGSTVDLGSFDCSLTQTSGLDLSVASGSAITIGSVPPEAPIDCAWVVNGFPGSIAMSTPPSLNGTFEVTFAGSSTLAPGEEAVLLDAPIECVPDDFAISLTQGRNESHLALVDETGIRLRRMARNDAVAIVVAPSIPAHLRMPCRLVATVDGTQYDVTSQSPLVSGDPNIVATLGNGVIRGVEPGTTTLSTTIAGRNVSVEVTVLAEDPTYAYDGVTISDFFAGNQNSSIGPSGLSANGRWVAFESLATNLDLNDAQLPPNYPLVFVHDRATNETTLASVTSAGEPADSFARSASISANGRYVVFLSAAPNLGGGPNQSTALVLRDRQLGVTETLLPGSVVGAVGVGNHPRISDDGRYVVFSTNSGLDPADTNAASDAYLFDRESGTTARVGLDLNLTEVALGTLAPTLSADGRTVLYWAQRASGKQLLVHDLDAGTVTALTEAVATELGGAAAALSADGERIAYRTLVGSVPFDIATWIVDRQGGSPTLLHQAPRVSDSSMQRVSISGDGAYVVSVGKPTAAVECGELSEVVLLHDIARGTTSVVSQRPGLRATLQEYSTASISRDGSMVAFSTYGADAIVPHDAPALAIAQIVAWERTDLLLTGDLDGDGLVGAADLAILLGGWGSSGTATDLDLDGTTGPSDLAILLGAWS